MLPDTKVAVTDFAVKGAALSVVMMPTLVPFTNTPILRPVPEGFFVAKESVYEPPLEVMFHVTTALPLRSR